MNSQTPPDGEAGNRNQNTELRLNGKKLKIAVSACLIGLRYRYDGEIKTDHRIIERLAGKVDLIPVCPEVECGLAVPRPRMQLESSPRGTRMIVCETREDKTAQVLEWADVKVEQLAKRDIAAFLFKSKSPSCGLASSTVYSTGGKRKITEAGSGIVARIIRNRFPNMIVGEEIDLESFLKNIGKE